MEPFLKADCSFLMVRILLYIFLTCYLALKTDSKTECWHKGKLWLCDSCGLGKVFILIWNNTLSLFKRKHTAKDRKEKCRMDMVKVRVMEL